jgi:hypothetical protein
LSVGGKWRRDRRSADKPDELASPHLLSLAQDRPDGATLA